MELEISHLPCRKAWNHQKWNGGDIRRGTASTKSPDILITWSFYKCKTLYLDFRNTYDHQTWQSSNLQWGEPTLQSHVIFGYAVTWQIQKTSTIPMAKLGRVVTYGWDTPPSKSRDILLMWSTDKCKTLYLPFCNTYGYLTWLRGHVTNQKILYLQFHSIYG